MTKQKLFYYILGDTKWLTATNDASPLYWSQHRTRFLPNTADRGRFTRALPITAQVLYTDKTIRAFEWCHRSQIIESSGVSIILRCKNKGFLLYLQNILKHFQAFKKIKDNLIETFSWFLFVYGVLSENLGLLIIQVVNIVIGGGWKLNFFKNFFFLNKRGPPNVVLKMEFLSFEN